MPGDVLTLADIDKAVELLAKHNAPTFENSNYYYVTVHPWTLELLRMESLEYKLKPSYRVRELARALLYSEHRRCIEKRRMDIPTAQEAFTRAYAIEIRSLGKGIY